MPPRLEIPFKFSFIISNYLLNLSGRGVPSAFPYNCCYSRLHPLLRNMNGAEYAIVTILISINKRIECLHPGEWACQPVNRIWFMLVITAPARSNPPMVNPIAPGGVPVSCPVLVLERENSTCLGRVFPDGWSLSGSTCLTPWTKVPFPTQNISVLSL